MSPIFVALLKNNELIGPSNLRVNRGICIFCLFGGRLPGVISPKSGSRACRHARKSKQRSQQAIQPTSQQASNEQPASEQAGKKERKKTASKQASQQASKPVCHPYPNGHDSTRLSPQCARFMRPEDIATEFGKCTRFCLWHSSFKPPVYEWLMSTSRHRLSSRAALITTHSRVAAGIAIATAFALSEWMCIETRMILLFCHRSMCSYAWLGNEEFNSGCWQVCRWNLPLGIKHGN